jgi:hypothetical protein
MIPLRIRLFSSDLMFLEGYASDRTARIAYRSMLDALGKNDNHNAIITLTEYAEYRGIPLEQVKKSIEEIDRFKVKKAG